MSEYNWVKLVTVDRFTSPLLAEKIIGGLTGTVNENGTIDVNETPDTLKPVTENNFEQGDEIHIRMRKNRQLYGLSMEEYNQKQQERKEKRKQKQQERKEKRKQKEKQRKEFWEQYNIPIDFTTGQNNRISELSRGSTGTGATSSTVTHFIVLEDFKQGRLERDAGRFLCLGEGKYSDNSMGLANEEPATPESGETKKVTCQTCLQRMERWKESK